VYSAGEEPIEGVDAEWLCRGIKEHGHKEVILCHSGEEVLTELEKLIAPGDVVLTLGAGDVHRLGNKLLEKL
jgi:UDP-N-acetylmuramate--alanine ligase